MNVEKLKVHPGSLMVFVDGTGREEFADPDYPVLGFGGCAVPAFVARDVLERPWRKMKERHFGGRRQNGRSADRVFSRPRS